MKRVTIQKVAEVAGVSITTVSRVMNKNYPVKEATKKKVMAVVEDLGYAPNLLARSLIQQSSKTIGILTPSLENLFFSEVIKGISHKMKECGYTVFLGVTEGDSSQEKEIITNLIHRQVDGIIMIDPRKEHVLSGYFKKVSKHLPLLLVNGAIDETMCDYVVNDDYAGMNEALNHFMNQGFTNIIFLKGQGSYSYEIKEKMYRAFMVQHHQKATVVEIEAGNDVTTVERAKATLLDLLKSKVPPVAILACNDWMAVGALNAGRELGKSIPNELRIIGFDNTIISQITEPKLSTVDQQMMQLGLVAGERLNYMMTHEERSYKKIYVATKLIIRDS